MARHCGQNFLTGNALHSGPSGGDYLTVTPRLAGMTNFSIVTWFRTTNGAPNYPFVEGGNAPTNEALGWIWGDQGYIYLQIATPSGLKTLYSAQNATNVWDGNWHQYGATWNGSTGNIFIDGGLIASGSMPGGVVTNFNAPLWLNQIKSGDGAWTRIYSTAISSNAVRQLYRQVVAAPAFCHRSNFYQLGISDHGQ